MTLSENKYDIQWDTPDGNREHKAMVRKMFNEPRNRLLCKIFIKIYMEHPISSSGLIKSMISNQIHLNKDVAHTALTKLMNYGLVNKKTITELDDSELDMRIRLRHKEFLTYLPVPFKSRYDFINYYYVNDYGEDFVPFVAKNLGLKVGDKNDSSKNVSEDT